LTLTSQIFDLAKLEEANLGSAKDPRRFQGPPSSLWKLHFEKRTWFLWELLKLCPEQTSDQKVSCPVRTLGRPMLSLGEFKLLQERSWNSWSTVCLHAAGSHPPTAAQAVEAEGPREGREARSTPKNYKFRKIS